MSMKKTDLVKHLAKKLDGRMKAAGTPAYVDTTLDSDRLALIEELRAERIQHHRDAEAALAAAEAGEAGELASDEIVPGIKDPFKRS